MAHLCKTSLVIHGSTKDLDGNTTINVLRTLPILEKAGWRQFCLDYIAVTSISDDTFLNLHKLVGKVIAL